MISKGEWAQQEPENGHTVHSTQEYSIISLLQVVNAKWKQGTSVVPRCSTNGVILNTYQETKIV